MPTINVDVDIDFSDYESELERAGYVHEDDLKESGWHDPDECERESDEDEARTEAINDTRQALLDWHDAEHGITDWVTCRRGPCEVIPREFKDGR